MSATKKFVYMKINAMNIKEDNINMIKRFSYNLLCNIDTLIRVNGPQEDLCDCTRCVFNDTKELGYLGCPFNWGCTFGKGNDYER